MNPVQMAGRRLAALLEAENAALVALDFPAVGRLMSEKTAALAALAVLQASAEDATLGRRLMALVAENRRLLERALLVQRRVIGTIARAAPRALAAQPRGYGRDGGIAGPKALPAMALSARA